MFTNAEEEILIEQSLCNKDTISNTFSNICRLKRWLLNKLAKRYVLFVLASLNKINKLEKLFARIFSTKIA